MMINKILVVLLLTALCFKISCAGRSNFYNLLFDIINKDGQNNSNKTTKRAEEMTLDELGISRGSCQRDFTTLISLESSQICYIDDEFILHLLPAVTSAEGSRKPPIMVKCLNEHPLVEKGLNKLRMMNSVQEIVDLLKPIGNNTKRYETGSCVLVYFYTPTCLACTVSALPINALPHAFKTLPVAAVDAYKFPSFNAEFGIVGLPTLMLFHQGRPIVKYRAEVKFDTFVTRHTGLKPTEFPKYFALTPLLVNVEYQTDYVLVLAWVFIFACSSYYFSKSRLCIQIIEMVKRNWRESEAQLERN
uniref:Thioredoxin domain-containing protein n=1 Tax=Glossina morsitans morsitans TaxID=37546 RepID=A0A1B0GD90_GLOMM